MSLGRLNVLMMVLVCCALANTALAQQTKLLPDDGAPGDYFGESVAMDGNTMIVGATSDDDNGYDTGSAYLFDTTHSGPIAKLLPNEYNGGAWFGLSVAISGNKAIIGAPRYTHNANHSGSAYLFDVTTGQQITKLVANDGARHDRFGTSVAISGNRAIIGASGDDDNGDRSGSAYLFDVTTGQQIAKLLPNDGAVYNRFGWSVAISGNTAIIGAIRDDDNGTDSGSAYLFDVTTGQQIAKLLPDDGAPYEWFGRSVAISGNTAIIGAAYFYGGRSSGSAYLFDVTTGQQIAKLLPYDGEAGDHFFGLSVAISGNTMIVGASYDDDNGTDSGSAYWFGPDTDGDGLYDDWEVNGIPYTGNDGFEHRYLLPDADPMHKDLYVEVDALTGFSFSHAAGQRVIKAFRKSPVTNPTDGDTGINLHILWDETGLSHKNPWHMTHDWVDDYDAWRAAHYGTAEERADPDHEALLGAKAKAYRYCTIADTAAPKKIGGVGPIGGDDFVCFFRARDGKKRDPINQAASFMHEFGHNLGLRHGGNNNTIGKPNYFSIMNYPLSYKVEFNQTYFKLDYSREGSGIIPDLDESKLDETKGIGSPTSRYAHYKMPVGYSFDSGDGIILRVTQLVPTDGRKWDLGDTAGTEFLDDSYDQSVVQDLNYTTLDPDLYGIPNKPSPDQKFEAFNDWENIHLPLKAAGSKPLEYPTDELTLDDLTWIDENFPIPPCQADITFDGLIDSEDFVTFLNAWSEDEVLADWNLDGEIDTLDLIDYLNDWAAGCP